MFGVFVSVKDNLRTKRKLDNKSNIFLKPNKNIFPIFY